jgi:carbon starvation protein
MTFFLLALLLVALVGVFGSFYSRFLSHRWGEDPTRPTPAMRLDDGRDFVPTPTPVVFAHHFASIAGAGPIIGPVLAVCYGWLPALIWIVLGGLLIGAVHDYLALYMTTREGGQSVATVARRILGVGPFVALVVFLILSLALVCATFLNLSAKALVSMVPHARLDLPLTQTLFRVVGEGEAAQVVIGGIASTSVIVITAFAPLVGWLYIRKQVAVWKCSLLAVGICAVSIAVGLWFPVRLNETTWKVSLAVYTLFAAGLPVWMFLQSRDFVNVHLLYVGLGILAPTVLINFLRGGLPAGETIPAWNIAEGAKAIGPWWPMLFITIACGAVSGFHSLCAGGTTCKQIKNERAARRIGYWGMLMESFLALCVVAVVVLCITHSHYLADVHPRLTGVQAEGNPILGFAMAVGAAVNRAFGVPLAVGALAGMLLLEGFVVTTLDTAVRLMRYLLEEVWKALFGEPRAHTAAVPADAETAVSCGVPASAPLDEESVRPLLPCAPLARFFGHYVVSSTMAVALMLWFAMSAGILSLWSLFATSNQLLAGFVLGLGAVWLFRRARSAWTVAIPAVLMFAVTGTSLYSLLRRFGTGGAKPNPTLYWADWALIVLTLYFLVSAAVAVIRRLRASPTSAPTP